MKKLLRLLGWAMLISPFAVMFIVVAIATGDMFPLQLFAGIVTLFVWTWAATWLIFR